MAKEEYEIIYSNFMKLIPNENRWPQVDLVLIMLSIIPPEKLDHLNRLGEGELMNQIESLD